MHHARSDHTNVLLITKPSYPGATYSTAASGTFDNTTVAGIIVYEEPGSLLGVLSRRWRETLRDQWKLPFRRAGNEVGE
jgi:hypothetical protein